MTDHLHEWEPLFDRDNLDYPWSAAEWRCECASVLTHDEIACRLNATERLKKLVADLQDAKDGPNEMGGPFVALSVIARTLEAG